jgi:hypothetical protein
MAWLGKRGPWCETQKKKIFDKVTIRRERGKGWILGVRDEVNVGATGISYLDAPSRAMAYSHVHEKEDFLLSVAAMLVHRKSAKKGLSKWFDNRQLIRIGYLGETPYRGPHDVTLSSVQADFRNAGLADEEEAVEEAVEET